MTGLVHWVLFSLQKKVIGWIILHCMYITHFVDPFIHWEQFGLLEHLAIAVNVGIQLYLWVPTSNILGYKPRRKISGS